MFGQPRIRKAKPLPPKKRNQRYGIEEVNFDSSARKEYLTGFHKRKLQRQKIAREEAAERERLERIEARKEAREERKQQLEEHLDKVNALLKEHDDAGRIDVESNSGAENIEAWEGFKDEPEDHEEEYVDEDKYTTVTVESVHITRDGLEKQTGSDEEGSDAEAEKKAKYQEDKPKVKTGGKKRKKKFTYETKFERQLTEKKRKVKKMKKSSS